jgi:hypothetical protein
MSENIFCKNTNKIIEKQKITACKIKKIKKNRKKTV